MGLILNIETSTDVCSVAISENGICVKHKVVFPDDNDGPKGKHSRMLAIMIDELLKESGYTSKNLDALAISSGPGSYTGLRIGVSTAKGFCFGADLPLIAVDTMLLMSSMAKALADSKYETFVPMIDARRMEVYTACFNLDLNNITKTSAKIIDEDSFSELRQKKTVFFGNGAKKSWDIIKSEKFALLDNIYPSAEFMGSIAEDLYVKKEFVDLVYYEPFYLKDFVATIPKNKLV